MGGLILLVGFLTRLLWLILLLALVIGVYLLINKLKIVRKPVWLGRGIKSVFMFIFVFCVAISVRLFLFEVFSIPSGSMENTLFPGDIILVNKLTVGPKMPRSPFEIPWINMICAQNKKAWSRRNEVWWKYLRLKGISTVQRNDVVVFRHPYSRRRDFFLVKRCVGLPGDTVLIDNSTVTINRNILGEAPDAKKIYDTWLKLSNNVDQTLKQEEIEILPGNYFGKNTTEYLRLNLSAKQKNTLQKYNFIDSIRTELIPHHEDNYVYNKDKTIDWTIADFGPFIIPAKGMTLLLTEKNFAIYRSVISRLEKEKLEFIDGEFYLKGKQTDTFTFKHDYYFMLGDNRNFSNDSRFWGVVPEEEIVGKASLILFSTTQKNKNASKRIFKPII